MKCSFLYTSVVVVYVVVFFSNRVLAGVVTVTWTNGILSKLH